MRSDPTSAPAPAPGPGGPASGPEPEGSAWVVGGSCDVPDLGMAVDLEDDEGWDLLEGDLDDVDTADDTSALADVPHHPPEGRTTRLGDLDHVARLGDNDAVAVSARPRIGLDHFGDAGRLGDRGGLDRLGDLGRFGDEGGRGDRGRLGDGGGLGRLGDLDRPRGPGGRGDVGHLGDGGRLGGPGGCGDLDDRVHRRLLQADDDQLVDDEALTEMVRSEDPLLDAPSVAAVVGRLRARMLGAGPLEPLLSNPAVTDVMVNGPGRVWVEHTGQLVRTRVELDAPAIALLVERVVARLGLRADRSNPVVDTRLPDGSRVHVVLPPLAVDGPYVTIRRFGASVLPLTAFCSAEVASLLRRAVVEGRNLVVSGGTGAGKTTLLNALCQHLPRGQRVVTIEDAAELRLPGDHVVRLESRPATPDGLDAVTVYDLLRAALRMRPDRLVVGEVRGGEALDLLQALNTGHDGSLSTCHANSPADVLRRIETLCLRSGVDLPLAAVREQLASALDLVVHVARRSDGARQVTAVEEVARDPGSFTRTDALVLGDRIIALPSRPPRRAPIATDADLGPGDGPEEDWR